MKNFLEKLQSSDESTKRRWMFGSTVIVMVIVVYVWLAYFNNLVGSFNEQQPAAPEAGFTFWQTMKGGMAVIYQTFVRELEALGMILKAPREYIVNPPK